MRKRTTIDLDQDLLREAAVVLGTTRTTDTVHAAMTDVIRRERRQSLLDVANDLDLAKLGELRTHRVDGPRDGPRHEG
jgi:Arc/MetJ family transcription regulator